MLAIRWVHLVAAAVALGGAATTWWLCRRPEIPTASALAAAAAYERAFWLATGALVLTGVGNLGELAPYVPTADTPWGTAFAAKLLAVIGVLAFSLVRTLAVGRCRRAPDPPAGTRRLLRASYAVTAAWFAGIVALAAVLAHG